MKLKKCEGEKLSPGTHLSYLIPTHSSATVISKKMIHTNDQNPHDFQILSNGFGQAISINQTPSIINTMCRTDDNNTLRESPGESPPTGKSASANKKKVNGSTNGNNISQNDTGSESGGNNNSGGATAVGVGGRRQEKPPYSYIGSSSLIHKS